MLSKKNVILLLVTILLIGTFLRFYKLGDNSFVADEFLDINSTYAYTQTGIWQNWDFNFGEVNKENAFQARDERAWVYKIQVAQLFKILPPTEGVARSISALWGIISILLIFCVARYFSKKDEIGLISAFLFAISISGLIFDRRLRMYAMFFAVFLAFSWYLFRFLEEKYNGKNRILKSLWEKTGFNFIYLIPALILGMISIMTHQLTANIVFIVLIYSIILAIIKFKQKIYLNKYSFIIILSIIGYFIGAALFPTEMKTYTAGLEFFNDNISYFSKIFTDYSSAILTLIFLAGGIYFLLKKQNLLKESLWLIVSFFGTVLLAVFIWDRNSGDQYIFFVRSFEIIIIASGIYFVADFFKENLKAWSKKAFLASIVLALLILPNYAYFFQQNNVYNQTSSSDSPQYKKIFSYFKKKAGENDVLITRNFRNYYWGGTKTKVYSFGGELSKEKLSLEEIKKITSENSSGWFIISDNDDAYISNDAIDYIIKNLDKVSNSSVRGDVLVYRWGK